MLEKTCWNFFCILRWKPDPNTFLSGEDRNHSNVVFFLWFLQTAEWIISSWPLSWSCSCFRYNILTLFLRKIANETHFTPHNSTWKTRSLFIRATTVYWLCGIMYYIKPFPNRIQMIWSQILKKQLCTKISDLIEISILLIQKGFK